MVQNWQSILLTRSFIIQGPLFFACYLTCHVDNNILQHILGLCFFGGGVVLFFLMLTIFHIIVTVNKAPRKTQNQQCVGSSPKTSRPPHPFYDSQPCAPFVSVEDINH